MLEDDSQAPDAKGWFNRAVAGAGITIALDTVNGAAKFISSATVDVVWTAVSPEFAFALAGGFMLTGTLMILRVHD